MIKKIRKLFYKYITLGVDEDTSINDLKKIQLLHIFCNTWHLFTLFSFIEDFINNRLNIISSYLLMIFLVINVQWLLYRKKIYIASLLYIFSLAMVAFFYANYIYKAELMEYYLILPFAISFIYIDNKIINIFILMLCWVGLWVPNLYFKHYPISVFNNQNVPFLFFSIYVVINYFKNLNIRNERILEAKTDELEALDKFKSQFFTNISHEIRTPLTLINGQVFELSQFTDSNSSIHNIQSGIKKQIQTITNMVDDVLDLAKMQSAGFQLSLKSTNVSQILHKVFLNFEPLLHQKNILFSLSNNSLDYYCLVDNLFFERAINNIIINALKYTNAGEVDIKTHIENDNLKIAITDTGIGIPKNDIKTIFNRFYQVDNDVNSAGGSGIGLAFSKEIIELHHGNIMVQSELGKGSSFIITLPLEKSIPKTSFDEKVVVKKAKEPKSNLDTNKNNSQYNFLVVDDNYDMRKYLVSILQNYHCLEAANGLEALKIIEQQKIDFIITDYMMPKLNGHAFISKLKKENTSIPTIMLTAKTDADTKLDVLKLGIDDYITKPFDKEELLARISNCFNNHTERNTYNLEHNIHPKEESNEFIIELKQYIYEKSHDPKLNQDEIANNFNLSKSSFYRKIKSETGLSPNNFIKEIRLQKAREILDKNPSILLKQLALEVGFANDTYFSKIYIKRFGIKPTLKLEN